MAFPAVRIPQELSRPGPAPVRLGHGTATVRLPDARAPGAAAGVTSSLNRPVAAAAGLLAVALAAVTVLL